MILRRRPALRFGRHLADPAGQPGGDRIGGGRAEPQPLIPTGTRRGDPDTAAPLAAEAVALARRIGTPTVMAGSLSALATALADRDPERARALLRESLDLSAAAHDTSTSLVTQATLTAARFGDALWALELATVAIPRLAWDGLWPQLAGVLNVVAWAATAEPDAAAVLQGAARRLALSGDSRSATQQTPTAGRAPTDGDAGLIRVLRREATDRIASSLGEARLRELRADGEAMDTDSAVRFSLAAVERMSIRA